LNKNLTLGGVFVLLSFLLTVPYAQAQADLTFRQRNARMIIPRYEEAKPLITEDGPKLIFSDSPEVSVCLWYNVQRYSGRTSKSILPPC